MKFKTFKVVCQKDRADVLLIQCQNCPHLVSATNSGIYCKYTKRGKSAT